MDVIGNIIDWIIHFVIDVTGCAAKDLNISLTAAEGAASPEKMINGVWHLCILVGLSLSIVYFLIEINRRWVFEGNDITLKTFAAPFLKLIFAIGVLSFGAEIFSQLLGWNNVFLEKIESIVSGATPEPVEGIGDNFNKLLDFWSKIAMLFPVLMAFLVTILCKLVWIYKAFTYKVELLGRVLFAPIAFADIYAGFSSTTVRYIKGTIALILYGAALIAIPKLCLAVAFADFQSAFENLASMGSGGGGDGIALAFDMLIAFLTIIVAPIAAIGVTSAAKNIAKEAVGA